MKLTSAPSPALDFVRRNDFLTKPDVLGNTPAVIELRPVGADTVELIVGDATSGPGDAEGDEVFADTAASVLEQVVDGVKLVVRTRDGYVGQEGYFSGDEQYFANALPNVTSQAAEVAWDRNGDGTIGDDESAFLFPVRSQADIDRLDPLIKPKIGDYEVAFEVE